MQWLNEDVCRWLVYSMFHLLWQALIPFTIWLLCNRIFIDRPQRRYASGFITLVTIAACLPFNLWYFSDIATPNAVSTIATSTLTANPTALPSEEAIETVQQSVAPVTIAAPASMPSIHIAAAPVTETRSMLPAETYPWFIGLYLLGVAFFGVRMLSGSLQTIRLRKRSHPITELQILHAIQRALAMAKLASAPAVLWCDRIAVPALVGVLKPVVLLPLHCATELSCQQIEQIVIHELSHFRRFDPIINMLQNLIETVFFFHPLVWYVSNRMRLDRELACDQTVVSAGYRPEDYATSLIQVASLSKRMKLSPVVGLAANGKPSQLQVRIYSLFDQRTRVSSGGFGLLCSGLLVLALVVLSIQIATPVQAQEKPAVGKQSDVSSDPTAVAKNELTGTVVDSSGKPIADAKVDLFTWYPGDETTTDANGRFRITPQHENTFIELSISKDGYSPYYIHNQPAGTQMDVSLGNLTYIQGTIRDPSGSPAADVEIRLQSQMPKREGGYMLPGPHWTARSSADGTYRIYASPDTYKMDLRAPGKGILRTENLTVAKDESKTFDAQLQPPVRFVANFVDSDSLKPVSGVHLFNHVLQPEFFGTSDADGKLVLDDMLPGQTRFNVGEGEPVAMLAHKYYLPRTLGRWWSDEAANEHSRLQLPKEENSFQRNFDDLTFNLSTGMTPVTIKVEKGVTFRGTVYDPDGKPVGGATVAPAKTGSGNSLTGDTRFSVKTNPDGTYEAVMPAGKNLRYNLIAHDGEFQQWRTWANGISEVVESKPGDIKSKFDLHLTRPASVRGRIVNPDGRSMEGREVCASPADKMESRYYVPTTKVSADGTFELKFIRAGKNYISLSPFYMDPATAPPGTFALVDLQSGQTLEGVELKMDESSPAQMPALAVRKFQITLSDSDGKPLANQSIVRVRAEGSQWPLAGTPADIEKQWLKYVSDSGTGLKTNDQGLLEIDGSKVFNSQNSVITLMSFDLAKRTGFIHRLFADAGESQIQIKMTPLHAVQAQLILEKSLANPPQVGLVFPHVVMQSIPKEASGAFQQIFLPEGKYQIVKAVPFNRNNAQDYKPPVVYDFDVPASSDAGQPICVDLK